MFFRFKNQIINLDNVVYITINVTDIYLYDMSYQAMTGGSYTTLRCDSPEEAQQLFEEIWTYLQNLSDQSHAIFTTQITGVKEVSP